MNRVPQELIQEIARRLGLTANRQTVDPSAGVLLLTTTGVPVVGLEFRERGDGSFEVFPCAAHLPQICNAVDDAIAQAERAYINNKLGEQARLDLVP